MKPLAIDLFCGLGGWTEGLLAEGWSVIGFDIERHDYGSGGYPAQLVLHDVRTLHGAQFHEADLIVASPPCQFFSRMAMPFKMPWKPEEYERRRNLAHELFWQPFRIQHEAQEASGREIPLVVENVVGAQRWVGRSRYKFGSFHLWGDLPALMPEVSAKKNGDLGGGSWFGISATNTTLGMNPDGRKNAHDGRDGHKGPMRNDPRDGTKFGGGWWNDSTNNLIRKASSRSSARKAASAHIAKIPPALSQWMAKVYKPDNQERAVQ